MKEVDTARNQGFHHDGDLAAPEVRDFKILRSVAIEA
jgi:hypothetical protein